MVASFLPILTNSYSNVVALRVEFLRARARCRRYQENIGILLDEQHRTLVSLEKTAVTWESRAANFTHGDPIIHQGAVAYASKQAEIQRLLANKFRTLWSQQDVAVVRKVAREAAHAAENKVAGATRDDMDQDAFPLDSTHSDSDMSSDEDLHIGDGGVTDVED